LDAVGITPEQVAIVDAWISRIEKEPANEISDFSHEHPGYQMVDENEPIPYASAFLADADFPMTDDDISGAIQVALERGWLVGNKWQQRQ
jgi:hypothetical protein